MLSAAGVVAGFGPAVQGGGQMVGTIGFLNEGGVELDSPSDEELDGRLYADLSRLNTDHPFTPPGKFYIRTRASRILPNSTPWTVKTAGLVERELTLEATHLSSRAEALGSHLMECSGNNRATRYGLLSVANWSGVPLADLIDKAGPAKRSTRVVISGFDEYTKQSVNSVPGASWSFTLDEIASSKAFLATHINDLPLSKDHGAPVRLVVPGWYGCACIKWVQSVTLADENVESTSQMREFASRTGQKGVPELARDFLPALIQIAAMPIRVEKWQTKGKVHYRVIGLSWGGSRRASSLFIRFNPEEDYVPVGHYRPANDDLWTIWTHDWSPTAPGKFLIRLMTKDHGLTQRLNSGFFVREVEIDDV